MLDAARLPERVSYYRRFLDFCADWNVNAVVFRLTDDQGCALRFESHPELLIHEHALTCGAMSDLVAYAGERGIEMIPEIESFGHSRYITSVDRYAHLSDKAADDTDWRNGLTPLHPDVLQLLGDLYEEAASIFPGRFLHGGCDEVTWGASAFSRDLLNTRSRPAVWAEYLNALNRKTRSLGKEFIVWADMVLRHEPDCLDSLDRDVILYDWDYWTRDPEALEETARKALEKGFRVIGGPAVIWARWGPRPGRDQLRNIDAYVAAYAGIDDERVLGVITTNWVPGRFLPGADLDGLAYAATAMSEGLTTARVEAFKRFVERHYRAEWDDLWGDVFHTLYAVVPCRRSNARPRHYPFLPVPWHDEETLAEARKHGPGYAFPYDRLLGQLHRCRAAVKRNREDFEALRLSVAYLRHIHWRRNAVAAAAKAGGNALDSTIAEIAREDAALLADLHKAWLRDRPPPGESQDDSGRPGPDDLPGMFAQAARFSGQLAGNPAGAGQ
jgi:hypothetical protein